MKFTIIVPTYRVQVNVLISNNQKKLDKFNELTQQALGEKEIVPFSSHTAGRSFFIHQDTDGCNTANVMFRKTNSSPGNIAHEAFHVTQRILEYCHIYLTEDSDEAYAYLLEYIVQSIHNEINEQ